MGSFLDTSTAGLPRIAQRIACWAIGKEAPPSLSQTRTGTGTIDDFHNLSAPSQAKLIGHYKGIVYTCSNINATACASVPMRLYVTTSRGQSKARCQTREVPASRLKFLQENKFTASRIASADNVEEVLDHPVLYLLREVNRVLNAFGLQELTILSQDLCGNAYWYIEEAPVIGPIAIWYLPAHLVTPKRHKTKIIDYYEYGAGTNKVRLDPEQIIHFRYPNPSDPYVEGISPQRACWESATLIDKESAYSLALYENRGFPSVLVSVKNGLGPGEAARLERKFARKFRKGGVGGIAVVDEEVVVSPFHIAPKDMENLARANVAERRLYNAYGVPYSFSDKDSNRASAEAGHLQHAKLAVQPRVMRHGEALTQGLAYRYDRRLFFAPDNPVPEDLKLAVHKQKADAATGDSTINERRAAAGLPPAEGPWGEYPSFEAYQADNAAPVEITTHPPEKPEKPPQKPDNEPEKALNEVEIYETLVDHAAGTASKAAALSRLEALGVKTADADSMLRLPALPPENRCCTDEATHKDRQLPSGKKLSKKLQATFRAQKRKVLDDLKRHVPKSAKKWEPPKEWQDDIDLSSWTEDMAKSYAPVVKLDYEAGMKAAARRMTVDPFSVSNPEVVSAVKAHTFMFCETTNATTTATLELALDRLAEELSENLIAPERASSELVKRVNAIFDKAEEHRAFRIAKTEASRAIHNGEILQGKLSGVVEGYEPLLATNACELCVDIAGANQAVSMSDAEKQLASYDRTLPPYHPHCMCTQTEILKEGE